MWHSTYGIMYVRASIYGIKITITLHVSLLYSVIILIRLISFVNPASKVNKYIRLFNF